MGWVAFALPERKGIGLCDETREPGGGDGVGNNYTVVFEADFGAAGRVCEVCWRVMGGGEGGKGWDTGEDDGHGGRAGEGAKDGPSGRWSSLVWRSDRSDVG